MRRELLSSRRLCCGELVLGRGLWVGGRSHPWWEAAGGTEGLSHAGEVGQAQRNRLEVGRGSVLRSAERRTEPVGAREIPPALRGGGASLTGSLLGSRLSPGT